MGIFMKYVKGKSELIIPDITDLKPSDNTYGQSFEEKLKKCLADSDPFQTAKDIYKLLNQTNTIDMPYKKRYAILQSLKNKMMQNTIKLKSLFTESEVMDYKSKYITEIIHAVQFEMLIGYKTIIDNGASKFFLNKSIILNSLHHAMYYASRIIYTSYNNHCVAPDGIWYDLHSLYRVSTRMGMSRKKLRTSFYNQQLNTIHDIYKNFLLFSILDTKRFRKNTISQLYYLTAVWAPLVEMTNSYKEDKTLFFVDPNMDCEPRQISSIEHHNRKGFYLDLTKVNNRIRQLIKYHAIPDQKESKTKFQEIETSIPLYLLDKILKVWSILYSRKQERKKIIQKVRVCVGLTSLLENLSQNVSLSSNNNIMMESLNEFSEMSEINVDATPLPEKTPLELISHKATTQPIYSTQTLDLNDAGCCLQWKESIAPILKSGEIVSIEMEDTSGNAVIAIGVIRWLKNEKNVLLTGIEFISKNAIPVLAKISDNDCSCCVASLLLPNSNSCETYTLLTNRFPFMTGNQVDIKQGKYTFEVRLQNAQDISFIYKKFAIEIISGAQEVQHIKQTTQDYQFKSL